MEQFVYMKNKQRDESVLCFANRDICSNTSCKNVQVTVTVCPLSMKFITFNRVYSSLTLISTHKPSFEKIKLLFQIAIIFFLSLRGGSQLYFNIGSPLVTKKKITLILFKSKPNV